LNDKAQPHVRAITDSLGCKLLLARDVRVPGQLERQLSSGSAQNWGQPDFLLHAIAFAPKDDLHGRVVDFFGKLIEVGRIDRPKKGHSRARKIKLPQR
jgi:enoyl-[acyl-carrier protein] reductase I